jgi:hypothetical protein
LQTKTGLNLLTYRRFNLFVSLNWNKQQGRLQEAAAVGHEGDIQQKLELTNFSKDKRIITRLFYYYVTAYNNGGKKNVLVRSK